MGTRVNYEIGDLPSAILFSNSHHNTEIPEELFKQIVARNNWQTNIVREMLNLTYKTDSGAHKAGESVFSIDLFPEDRERVYRVSFGDEGGVITITDVPFSP